jgi:hypothetical protein
MNCPKCKSFLRTTRIDGTFYQACSNEACSYITTHDNVPVSARAVAYALIVVAFVAAIAVLYPFLQWVAK